jgi:uncharacterized protein YjbI with pentapeptide repeats
MNINEKEEKTDRNVPNNTGFSDHTKIITDEPSKDATDFKSYAYELSNFILNSVPRFTVGIYGGWGTGKTTLMQMVKENIDKNYSEKVETIWFDSWRYEGEEYSALVPLLRTIILGIDNALKRKTLSPLDNQKRRVLIKLKDKFTKVSKVVIRNTTGNIGVKAGNIMDIGASFNFGKMMDDYKSDGSFIRDQQRIYFHKHISEHLSQELHKIRYNEKDELVYDFRLIIFIDDLDRCTPERALELLESIKTFFDIEGIIYVIGIEPKSIDPIIQTKYGEKTKINGMEYLQKVVQLPFQIPIWSSVDLSNAIRGMISKTGISESDVDRILDRKKTNVEMIVRAAQLNPRDVKRFVNTVILSLYIYNQKIADIEKLIAVQAFYFRGNKWIDFLKLLTPYRSRIDFLKNFIIILSEQEISSVVDLGELVKNRLAGKKELKLDKSVLEIFKKLVELDDNDLFVFLKTASPTLLKIDKMEKYLRVAETTGMTDTEELFLDIDSERQYELLKDLEAVTKFNEYRRVRENLQVHLPYAILAHLDLNGIDFSKAFLFEAEMPNTNLSGANFLESNLTRADLTKADLSRCIMIEADLHSTNLTGANLSSANFSYANLTKSFLSGARLVTAFLPRANLSDADLSWSDLTKANLVKANLSRATLSGSKLSGADLSESDLSGADLSGADLSKASLSGADLSGADLSGADLSGADFSQIKLGGADLSGANLSDAYLINVEDFVNLKIDGTKFDNSIIDNEMLINILTNSNAEGVPQKISDKLELKSKLTKKGLSKAPIEYFLRNTKLR